MEIEKVTKINYEIHSFSSFSSSYLPENIRDDFPTNQISRWSSETNTPTQFITLRLQKPAIVKYIKFGKYEKSHVCNLKKFKIYGGLQENNMFQIFEGGLKNDNIPETFNLKHKMYTADEGQRDIPILYLSILPLLSFGPSFNFSIWYVELQGIENDVYVCDRMKNFNEQREKQAIRLVLKHLRDKGYMAAFQALEREAKINLEDNQVTELFQSLVEEGNFQMAEEIMQKFIENGDYIDEYISNQKYKASYNEILPLGAIRPKNRSCAAFAFDSDLEIVYMFGGHCEETLQDLRDFWQFNLKTNTWIAIEDCNSTSPSARSGVQMIYDSTSKQIFMLGRKAGKGDLVDNFKNDFYLYDTQYKTWLLICEDVSQMNGPSLLYDHQICINSKNRTLYVFGGKVINKSEETSDSYSGFYSYHINTNTWKLDFLDINHQLAANPETSSIKSRTGFRMFYDNIRKKIYIVGGERGKETCNDFMQLDVDGLTNVLAPTSSHSHVASPSSSSPSTSSESINFEKPSGLCFATIELKKGEIYVLMKNSLWMYDLATNEFSMIHSISNATCNAEKNLSQICSRSSDINYFIQANELLYVFTKTHGEYSIQLQKPSRGSVLNYCKYLIRRQQYEEIARSNFITALAFLRNNLAETIDKNDINQVNDFHKLASLLFCNKLTTDDEKESDGTNEISAMDQSNKIRSQRSILFNKLTSLLPQKNCQPQQSLLNFISI